MSRIGASLAQLVPRSIRSKGAPFALGDVVAGVSVAAVLVPQSIAYAQLAGMPASRGLFAAAIPPLVAAPFASSPYLQPGPTAVSALLTFGALSPLAAVGSQRYVELGLLLALLVGAIRVLVGVLNAGVLAYMTSHSLLSGFIPAAALLIVSSQIPVALGTHGHGGNALLSALWSLEHPGSWHLTAVAIAAIVALTITLARRTNPLIPGVLLAIIIAGICGSEGFGGAKVGTVHAGVPPLTTHLPWRDLTHLILPATVIALLGFAEASSIARTYAALERTRWDANREFVSQGVANLGAGMFGGFPVGASFSRSALNRLAGAKTNLSSLVTGLTVLALLPFAFILGSLPRAALAATVIVAVFPLLRFGGILEIARLSRPQLSITLTAFLLTLVLTPHIERAILVAVAVSVGIHLWRELRLDVKVKAAGGTIDAFPEGVLWFGNAQILQDRAVALLASHPEATSLRVHLDGLGRIDLAGALALRSIAEDVGRAGLSFAVDGTPQHASRVLARVLAPSKTGDEPEPATQGNP